MRSWLSQLGVGAAPVLLLSLLLLAQSSIVTTLPTAQLTGMVLGRGDACPDIEGDSWRDREGCLDSDGDGWSDPDSEWGVNDGADALVDDPTQWLDEDGDGWGDNHSRGATNIDHWPSNSDLHLAVVSVGCDPPSHELEINESASFTCAVSNPMPDVSIWVSISFEVDEELSTTFTPVQTELPRAGHPGHKIFLNFPVTSLETGRTKGLLSVREIGNPSVLVNLTLPVRITNSTIINIEPPLNQGEIENLTEAVSEAFLDFESKIDNLLGGKHPGAGRILLSCMGVMILLSIIKKRNMKKRARNVLNPKITKPSHDEEAEEGVIHTQINQMDGVVTSPSHNKKPIMAESRITSQKKGDVGERGKKVVRQSGSHHPITAHKRAKRAVKRESLGIRAGEFEIKHAPKKSGVVDVELLERLAHGIEDDPRAKDDPLNSSPHRFDDDPTEFRPRNKL